MIYVLFNKANQEVYETQDYLDAIHYQMIHPDCTIRKFLLT